VIYRPTGFVRITCILGGATLTKLFVHATAAKTIVDNLMKKKVANLSMSLEHDTTGSLVPRYTCFVKSEPLYILVGPWAYITTQATIGSLASARPSEKEMRQKKHAVLHCNSWVSCAIAKNF
jgi:hypothetical protein